MAREASSKSGRATLAAIATSAPAAATVHTGTKSGAAPKATTPKPTKSKATKAATVLQRRAPDQPKTRLERDFDALVAQAQAFTGKAIPTIMTGLFRRGVPTILLEHAMQTVSRNFELLEPSLSVTVTFELEPLSKTDKITPAQRFRTMITQCFQDTTLTQVSIRKKLGWKSKTRFQKAFFPGYTSPGGALGLLISFFAATELQLVVAFTPADGAAGGGNGSEADTPPTPPGKDEPSKVTSPMQQLEILLRQTAGLSPEAPPVDAVRSAATIRNATLALGNRRNELPEGITKLATRYLDTAVSARDLGLCQGLAIAFGWAETFAAHAHSVIAAIESRKH